jgi:hypothetical protein
MWINLVARRFMPSVPTLPNGISDAFQPTTASPSNSRQRGEDRMRVFIQILVIFSHSGLAFESLSL